MGIFVFFLAFLCFAFCTFVFIVYFCVLYFSVLYLDEPRRERQGGDFFSFSYIFVHMLHFVFLAALAAIYTPWRIIHWFIGDDMV